MIHLLSSAAVLACFVSDSITLRRARGIFQHVRKSRPLRILRSRRNRHPRTSKTRWNIGIVEMSSECGRLQPPCILVPKTPEELSIIVKTLGRNKEIFAVKSSGNNPNGNFSRVDGGPLISLKDFNEIKYDAASGTVRIGAGNRWTHVVKTLEPQGVTAAGARIGHVGVGGFILGGGLNFWSTQVGWSMNTVVQFDVAFASGKIAKAFSSEKVDMFNVLRGGGNAYGIVTTYTLKAHKIGKIWGGYLTFGPDKTNEVLAAIRDFTEYYSDDKAAIIASHGIIPGNKHGEYLVANTQTARSACPEEWRGLLDLDDSVDRIFMVMNNAYNLISDIPTDGGGNGIPRRRDP
ncbi:hypothetical protein PAAG_11478 [Paracoccidioides lutzii Pb01]|uniref:FAD-binding PCMH-type domain-containing protein n=1 Tax=Paracoccidioides lutzii (strain ATCC MYA-826 / Pb01) TaxID=502779 RepID=A0A0A2VLN3_PARBA|nr:hypothetical protein PAAG_11478 [Paracoccidioides lutzii Pb01]KGQ01759.1 hypothetical protein PAAG_11478 [Paracoccidioides lutzii Pb01]